MAYKLPKEDQLCGVVYNTYTGYKPIPKATCPANSGGCGDNIKVVLNCGKDKQDTGLHYINSENTNETAYVISSGESPVVSFRSSTPLANPLVVDPSKYTRSDGKQGTLYSEVLTPAGSAYVNSGRNYASLGENGKFTLPYETVGGKVVEVEFTKNRLEN